MLARHLYNCFVAAWNRFFLVDEKQGTGAPFEQFIWHFEAVRRELLLGRTMAVKDFLNLPSAPPIADKEFKVTSITSWRRIPNDFDCSSPAASNTRYEPEMSNFPLYDCFSGWQPAKRHDGDVHADPVMWGWQMKHGQGRTQPAATGMVSVFVSTRATNQCDAWSNNGWLVLAGDDLKKYLGPTMSAAAAALVNP